MCYVWVCDVCVRDDDDDDDAYVCYVWGCDVCVRDDDDDEMPMCVMYGCVMYV